MIIEGLKGNNMTTRVKIIWFWFKLIFHDCQGVTVGHVKNPARNSAAKKKEEKKAQKKNTFPITVVSTNMFGDLKKKFKKRFSG